jgi:hypothetical protein
MQSAMSALQKTLAQIQKDPNWSNSQTTGDASAGFHSMPLVQWLGSIIKELGTQVGQFQNKQINAGQSAVTTPAAPAPGVSPGPSGTPPGWRG